MSIDAALRAEFLDDEPLDESAALLAVEANAPKTFPDGIDLKDQTFNHLIELDGAVFSSSVRFQNCTFARGFSFKGAIFHGAVSFQDCLVQSAGGNRSSFDGAKFRSAVRFDKKTALYLASFVGCEFERSAKFRNRFYASAKFDQCTFLGPANFTGAIFHGSGSFSNAVFKSTAEFEGAKFKYKISHARFGSAVFHQFASFERAEFSGNAEYAQTHFRNGVTFNGARFCLSTGDTESEQEVEGAFRIDGDLTVNFTEAHFVADDDGHVANFAFARFGDHNFTRSVVFDGASFYRRDSKDPRPSSIVDFEKSEVLGPLSMRSAFFKKGVAASFVSSRFEGDVDLSDAEFASGASWQKSKFGGSVTVTGTKFHSYPDFLQTEFFHYPQLRDASLPDENYFPENRKEAAHKVAALRRLAARTDDKETELGLLVKELRLAGGFATKLYGLLSDYGRSWFRPAFWLVVATVVLYPLLYLAAAGVLPTTHGAAHEIVAARDVSCVGAANGSAAFAAMEHSLRTALIVGQENETRTAAIQSCLAQESSPSIHTVGRSFLETSQILVTLILAFLIGEAVRRRLQLR